MRTKSQPQTDADRIIAAIEASTVEIVAAIEGIRAERHSKPRDTSSPFDHETVSVSEAAAMLGIDRTTLYRLMNDGRIGFTRPSSYRRLLRSEVIQYLKSQYVPPIGD